MSHMAQSEFDDDDALDGIASLSIEDELSYAESILELLLSRICTSSYQQQYRTLVAGDISVLKQTLIDSLSPKVQALLETGSVPSQSVSLIGDICRTKMRSICTSYTYQTKRSTIILVKHAISVLVYGNIGTFDTAETTLASTTTRWTEAFTIVS